MKAYWYDKVDTSYARSNALGSHAQNLEDTRRAYAVLGKEPALAGAVLAGNIPIPTVNRIAAERMAKQGYMRQQQLAKNGLERFDDQGYRDAAKLNDKRHHGGWFGGLLDKAGNILGGALNVVVDGSKHAIDYTLEGLENVYNVVDAPIAAARADGSWSDSYMRWLSKSSYPDWKSPLRILSAPAVAGAQLVSDLGEGYYRIASGDLSDEQARQMRLAGLDPGDFTDRYSFYYNNWHGARDPQPISKRQLDYARSLGIGEPDIRAMEEYILSGAALEPDGGITQLDGLSPNTQRMVRRMLSPERTASDDKLMRIFRDSSPLHFGSSIAESVGYEPGSTAYKLTTAGGDLVGLWFVDPIAAGMSLRTARRAAQFGVPIVPKTAGADRLSHVAEAIVETDKTTRLAQNGVGKAIDRVLNDVDRIALLSASENAAHRVEAARIAEKLRRELPQMDSFAYAAMETRVGHARAFIPIEANEVRRVSQRATRFGQDFTGLKAVPGEGRPAWFLRETADEAMNVRNVAPRSDMAEKLSGTRAVLGDQLLSLIMKEAWTSGRPFMRGKIMLPGEIRTGAKLRGAAAGVFDALSKQDASLEQALALGIREGKTVTFADTVGSAVDFDARLGSWRDVLKPRQFGVAKTINRAQVLLERSYSGRPLTFGSAQGTETMRRFVTQIMGSKRLAYDFMNDWSRAGEAGRMAMARNLFTSILEEAGARGTPAQRRMLEVLTKGFVSDGNESAIGVRKLANEFEVYSPVRNTIRIGDQEFAAGLLPSHMADGMTLPSYRDLRMASGRALMANKVLGISNAHQLGDRFIEQARAATMAWKSGKTGTFGNAWRQTMEAYGLLAVLEPSRIPEVARMRRELALAASARRLGASEARRAGRRMQHWLFDNPDAQRELERIERLDDLAFREELIKRGMDAGLSKMQARVMAYHSESIKMGDEILSAVANVGGDLAARLSQGRAEKTFNWLFMAKPLNRIRMYRLRAADTIGRKAMVNSGWQRWVDDEIMTRHLDASMRATTGHYSGNEILSPGRRVAERGFQPNMPESTAINDALAYAETNFPVRSVRLQSRTPNMYEARDAIGEPGAARWVNDLDFWSQDEIGGEVLRALVAKHYRGDLKKYLRQRAYAEAETHPELQALRARLPEVSGAEAKDVRRRIAAYRRAHLKTKTIHNEVEDYVLDMIKHNDILQRQSQRLTALDGRLLDAADEAGREAAARVLADDIIATAEDLIGMRRQEQLVENILDGTTGRITHSFDESYTKLYNRIAQQLPVRVDDVRGIADDLRPAAVRQMLFVPDLTAKTRGEMSPLLARFASRNYDLTVAKPIQKFMGNPVYLAELDFAFRNLEPVAEALVARGMTHETAGHWLLHQASKSAAAKVFNLTDDAANHSMLVELIDNWALFSRAMEDGFRRLGNVASYNPARAIRSWSLAQAAQQSGIVYSKPVYSDDGSDARYETYFVFPGSATAARLINDAMRNLGFGDWIQQPIYSGVEAPVKFFNPALQNPLGFSANPIFGGSLRALRFLMPGPQRPEIDKMIHAIEGGEDYFAAQSLGKQLIPSNITRAMDFLPPQFDEILAAMPVREWEQRRASSALSATMYAAAAGIIHPNMTDSERQQAIQAIRYTGWNILAFRAAVGMFGPAVAFSDGVRSDALPDVTTAAQLNGIRSLREEWFAILNAMSNRYDNSDLAFGEAMTEWLRRYPRGKSIFSPQAITAGTSKIKGVDTDVSRSIPRNKSTVQWVKDNWSLFENHRDLFPYLVPAVEGKYFSSTANQALYQMGVLEHQDLNEFFDYVANKVAIDEWWATKAAYDKERLNGGGDAATAEFYDYDSHWRMLYPEAALIKDKHNQPSFIHGVIAPDLRDLVADDNLPPELARLRPQLREMYNDYASYREEYAKTPLKNRYLVNTAYRNAGYAKWNGTRLYDIWRLLDVREDGAD